MYEEFYKLDRAPFDTTPDPTFFFMSDGHQEALAALVYGIDRRKGFISMIGEVGTGKTTVLRAYIESEHVKNTRIIYLFNPRVSYEDLLLMVLRELRVEIPEGETKRVDLLHRVLVNEYKNGNNVVLIVDEAQNIPPETLESMRMLSNLETSSEKLIQIVLSGQPELDDILGSNRLRQLRQRIAVKVRLEPLSRAEAGDYVRYRLRRAGGDDGVFTKDAINWVVRYTGGNPRSINVLCDNALITGYGYQQFPISTPIIKEIAKEFDIKNLSTQHGTKSDNWLRVAGAVLAVTGVASLIFLWGHFNSDSGDTTPAMVETSELEANGSVAESETANEDDVTDVSNAEPIGVIDAQPVDDQSVVETQTLNSESVESSAQPEKVETADAVEAEADTEVSKVDFESVIQASPEEMALTEAVAESAPLPDEPALQELTAPDAPDNTESTQTLVDSESEAKRVQRTNTDDETVEVVPAISSNQVLDEAPALATSTVQDIADQDVADQDVADQDVADQDVADQDIADQDIADQDIADQQAVATAVGVVISDAQPIEASGDSRVVIIDGVRQTVGAADGLPPVTLDSSGDDASEPDSAGTVSEEEPVAVVEVDTTETSNEAAQQAVRIVNSGDNLWDMTREVYGRVNDDIVDRVMESNPDVTSASAIYVGQKIVFPEL